MVMTWGKKMIYKSHPTVHLIFFFHCDINGNVFRSSNVTKNFEKAFIYEITRFQETLKQYSDE